MRANEFLTEKWSQKYKSSINCSHPKGFSQKAHCAGKKKHNESITMESVCPDCGMCQTHGNLNEIKKGQKDSNGYTKCWPGHHAQGTKKSSVTGKQVRNCVPNEGVDSDVEESGLQYYTGVKKYGKKGMEKLAQAGREGANQQQLGAIKDKYIKKEDIDLESQFDIIESMIEYWAEQHGVDSDAIWEDLESVDDQELLDESAAWHRKAGKNPKGGLNAKGVASYRREHPGSHLQMAVTTKPSKLKPGSKAAKRRKSFCARMGGVKGPMKKPNGKPTRKALALRKWNCE